jgi:uncharacterized protein (DUF486 family)
MTCLTKSLVSGILYRQIVGWLANNEIWWITWKEAIASLIWGIFPAFVWRNSVKPRETSVKIADIWTKILSRISITWLIIVGSGWMNRFIEYSLAVTTNNYYTIADLHNLQSLHANLHSLFPVVFTCRLLNSSSLLLACHCLSLQSATDKSSWTVSTASYIGSARITQKTQSKLLRPLRREMFRARCVATIKAWTYREHCFYCCVFFETCLLGCRLTMNVPLLLDARWLERVYRPLPSNMLIKSVTVRTPKLPNT